MATSYADIEKQIAALKAKAAALKAKEVEGVIARIKVAIETYQLTAADLGFGPGSKAERASVARAPAPAGRKRTSPTKGRKLGKVPVKYKDKNGNTWTGRGNHPVWLREAIKAGAKLESFRV